MEVAGAECPQPNPAGTHGALRMLVWFGEDSVLVARCGHPVVQRSQF